MSIYKELGFTAVNEHPEGAVVYALARTVTLLERHFRRYYAQYGLDPVKVNALMIIKHLGKDDGIPQQALAERLILTAGSVTPLVDRLERKGLIKRHGTQDRRVKLLTITAKGAQLLDALWPGHRQLAEQLVTLSAEKRQRLLQLLGDIRAAT